MTYLSKFFYLIGERKKTLPLMVFFFLISSITDLIGIGLMFPYVSLILDIDNGSTQFIQNNSYLNSFKSNEHLIYFFSILIMLIFIFKALVSVLINRIIIKFSFQVGVDLRSKLMAFYQNMSYLKYLERNSSEYIYNTQSLTSQFSTGVLQSFLRAISEGIVCLVILIFLAYNDPLAVTIFMIIFIFVGYLFDRYSKFYLQSYGQIANEFSQKMIQSINEGIYGYKEIKVLRKEAYFYDQVISSANKYAKASTKSAVISMLPRQLIELVIIIAVVTLISFYVLLNQNINAIIPIISMFGIASIRLVPSANIIISSFSSMRFLTNCIDVLYNDLSKHSPFKKILEINSDKEHFDQLEVNNVYFKYGSRSEEILSNISFSLKNGECIGVIGSSGSGKTTLIDIIIGFLKPYKGSVHFNKKNIHNNLDKWLSQIAYISQDGFLIDSTLINNITLTNEDNIDNNRLKKVLEISDLSRFIESLPDGYNTQIGDKGLRISGGQKQRIAIARALYNERNIIIFDEATSALDTETEKVIVEEIERYKGKITMIIIAHRLSTLKYCDKIIEIKNGKFEIKDNKK